MTAWVKCAWNLLRHKCFVFMAGIKIGVPIVRLIMHDASKFGRSEFPHYSRHFYGSNTDPGGFARAWLHHQNCNDHYWEHWISRGDSRQKETIVPMTEDAVREMIADWIGATRAYGGKWPRAHSWPWFITTWPLICDRLHADTRALIFSVMKDSGYRLVLEQTAEQKEFLKE